MNATAHGERLKSLVILNYDIDKIISINQIGGGTANTNLIVSSDIGNFFLRRRNPKYSNENTLIFDHLLMNHLIAQGLCTPFPIKTKDHKEWVRTENDVYELFKHVEGKDYSQENIDQLIQSAITLARFHMATFKFNIRKLKDWPRYDDPNLIERGLDIISKYSVKEDRQLLAYLYLLTKKLKDRVPDHVYWSLPTCIIHGDYHPANLKFSGEKVIGVFDLDWATRQPRVRDIADGILDFAAKRKKPINGGNIFSLTQECFIDIERSKLFINAYREHLELTDSEFELLPYFMRARWLYSRISGMKKVKPEMVPDYFITGISTPLLWLDDNEREFVDTLKKGN
jgi:Ser/Thr protein kinase RdoA (MazF antagonist)